MACKNYNVTINQLDLNNAINNIDSDLNGKVFISFTDCNGEPSVIAYETAGTYPNAFCADDDEIVIAYYFFDDLGNLSATSRATAVGDCIAPTPSPTPTPSISISPTPSPTPLHPCNCISFTNVTTGSLGAGYTACDGSQSIRITVQPGTSIIVCGSNPGGSAGIVIDTLGTCVGKSCIPFTPTPTPSLSITPTISLTPSITPSNTPSISVTPSNTPSISITPSITPSTTVPPSMTPTPTISVSTSPSITPLPSISRTPSRSVTPSVTPSMGTSPTPTPTLSTTGSIPTVDGLCMNIQFGAAPSVTPSISVSRTPSATPTATPSVTPTITPTSTNPPPTPSRTPSNTPSLTPSNTPSITPSRTPSISITPNPSSPTECPVYYLNFSIINGVGAYRSYYYSLLNNTSTLVTTSTYPLQGGPITDLTFSNDKFWYLTNGTTGNPNNPSTYAVRAVVIEFNRVNATNMSYNRTLNINLPSGSSSSGYSGFCVLNSNTLLSTRSVGTSIYSPIIIALNITGNGSSTDVFTPIQGRFISGMLYTTAGKLITISSTSTGQNYITQYSYPSGVVEFDLLIQSGNGTIFENNGGIYFTIASSLYKINNNAPYSVTFVNNIGGNVQNSSGINNCNTVNFVPNIAGICDDILYKTQGNQYYSYNFPSNTSTLLNVPAAPYDSVATSLGISIAPLARTSNKLWSYTWNVSGGNLNNNSIVEYNTTSNPFAATINRYIALPQIGIEDFYPGTGLFAISNTKLIGTINRIGGQELSTTFTEPEFNDPIYPLRKYANGAMVVEYDITSNIATWTLKVKLLAQEKVTGGLLLTLDNKLIVLTKNIEYNNYWISQYNYNTGVLEFRSKISPTITTDCGLAEVNGEIYIMGYNIYKFNRITHTLELTQSPQTQLVAATQLASCVNVNLPTSSCPECIGLPLKLSTPVTYGDVTISPTYTGPLFNAQSGTPGAADNLFLSPQFGCTGSNVVNHPSYSVWLGGAQQNPYTYSLNFSEPVNNIKLIYDGNDTNVLGTLYETFIWDTNGGTPNISLCKGCGQIINGNTISASWGTVPVYPEIGISGGGIITISAPLNYTTLTLRSPGGNQGTVFGICSGSVVPRPNNALGCVYSTNGTNTYLYNVINNTSSSVTIPIDQQPNPEISSANDTHTLTKYWKGNRWNTIKEWIPTNTPNVLALNRTITVEGFPYLGSGFKQFLSMQAINDTTLLVNIAQTVNNPSNIFVGNWINTVTLFDITTNTVGPAQQTSLFTVYAPAGGADGFLLTTNNKLIIVGRRGNGVDTSNYNNFYLSQYSYPDGALELDISLAQYLPSSGTPSYLVSLFESNNGKLYLKAGSTAALQSKIYEINLNSPYVLTEVWSDVSQRLQNFNSSVNCNTVALNVAPPPPPQPSLSPSPTPSLTPPVSPNVGVNTIYKYLDIL